MVVFPPASESPHIGKDVEAVEMFHAFFDKTNYLMRNDLLQFASNQRAILAESA
jgi:hypothetical protein